MPRKRYKPSSPETLLADVVKGLEGGDESGLEAIADLISRGPLVPVDGTAWSLEAPHDLLRFLRELVISGGTSLMFQDLWTSEPLAFQATLEDGRVQIGVKAESGRDFTLLQLIVLLQQVGIPNVRACSAPGCKHIYVKVNRRLFCSPQCQKRVYARAMRGRQRELRERRQRARQRRQRGGAN